MGVAYPPCITINIISSRSLRTESLRQQLSKLQSCWNVTEIQSHLFTADTLSLRCTLVRDKIALLGATKYQFTAESLT